MSLKQFILLFARNEAVYSRTDLIHSGHSHKLIKRLADGFHDEVIGKTSIISSTRRQQISRNQLTTSVLGKCPHRPKPGGQISLLVSLLQATSDEITWVLTPIRAVT